LVKNCIKGVIELREEEWGKVSSFYRELKKKYDQPVECMIELVRTIQSLDKEEKLWPSTSMSSLGLSYFEQFSDRLTNPMIYIFGTDDCEEFIVSKQKGQGNTVEKLRFKNVETDCLFLEINSWLSSS